MKSMQRSYDSPMFQCHQDVIEAVAKVLDANHLTVDIPIFCGHCGVQHVDRPEPEGYCMCGCVHGTQQKPALQGTIFGVRVDDCVFCDCTTYRHWNNPPHSKHLCKVEDGGCGKTFKPFPFNTNGVRMDT